MAIKLGLIGIPNSGKSFSRHFIKKGEDVFILAPSHKAMHLSDSKGVPIKRLKLDVKKDTQGKVESIKYVSGNWKLVADLKQLQKYLKLVSDHIPHIKTIIIPDFTHYISKIIATKAFIEQKKGGEAYQRFWQLAADALNYSILAIDNLRDDLIVVTEYHSEYDEISEMYKIFVPGGKMLEEKFKLDSYYDFMLYTHVEKDGEGEVLSHNFVTKKWGSYNARSAELFEDTLIPNNLEVVLKKMRDYLGLD